ncbi:hypothetical protein IF2G_05676 [Cordyceps javanica]|nr:hypothetical protein IF2G_05676 [Cordyceps javanica]
MISFNTHPGRNHSFLDAFVRLGAAPSAAVLSVHLERVTRDQTVPDDMKASSDLLFTGTRKSNGMRDRLGECGGV